MMLISRWRSSSSWVAVAILAAIGSVSLAVPAAAQQSLRDEKAAIAAFLREHVMQQTLVDEGEVTMPESHLKVRYRARITFTGLAETENGFSFREIDVVQKTKFDIDEDGQVVSEGINRDVAGVAEYLFAKRRSGNRLVGTVSNLEATSVGRPVGVDAIPRITLANGKLTMVQRGVLYDDYFAAGEEWRPGSADSVHEFWIEEGRLHLKITRTYFDVDVETLERTPRGESSTTNYRAEAQP